MFILVYSCGIFLIYCDETLRHHSRREKMAFVKLQTILKYFVLIFLFCSFFAFSSEQKKSYYEILNISNTAGPDEIQKAYRSQAMKYHPDRAVDQEDANEKMAEINAAYSLLKQPEMRKKYDQILQSVQGNNTRNLEVEFYSAFEIAVSDYSNGPKRAMNFYFIDIVSRAIKFKLSDQQVHSIVKVVIDIDNSMEFVRRAAITALESYTDQLFIEDIELLLVLSSSKNKIDDRGIKKQKPPGRRSLMSAIGLKKSESQTAVIERSSSTALSQHENQNFQEEFSYEKGIKKRAEEIAKNWFTINFQQSASIDQILKVVVDIDNAFIKGMDFFRKEALDTLERNIQKLIQDQIDLLQKFDAISHHSYLLKKQVKKIIKQWQKLDSASKGTAIINAGDGEKSLIRAEVEQALYARDPELYNLKGVGDSITYLNNHPELSPDRVQEIADHTLNYIYSFQNGINVIRTVDEICPDCNKEKLIDKSILYIRKLSEAQTFVGSVGKFLASHHFDQILDQILPFIENERGLRGGTFFLHNILRDYLDEEHKFRVVQKLKTLPVHRPGEAEKFINIAGKYLSEQDRQDILRRSSSSCQKSLGSKNQ